MRAKNKVLVSAVMMALVSSTVAVSHSWATAGLIDGKVLANGDESTFTGTSMTNVKGVSATNGGKVKLGFLGTESTLTTNQPALINAIGGGAAVQIEGAEVNIQNKTSNVKRRYPAALAYKGTVSMGFNDDGQLANQALHIQGDVVVPGKGIGTTDTSDAASIINIGLGKNAIHGANEFDGRAVNGLIGKGGEINMTIDGGKWYHSNMNSLSLYADDNTPSTIHTLTGTKNRSEQGLIGQDTSKDINVDKLDGHVNVIYRSANFTGAFRVTSATPGSAVHAYMPSDRVDMTSIDKVNTALDRLAHKFYYDNYVSGERNLTGTVAIASAGVYSSAIKVANLGNAKEGDITWQDNGQGQYILPTPKPEPTPVTPVTPEPTPVTPVNPEPTPVTPVNPEPTPVTPVTPEPTPVTPVNQEPTPVTPVTPEPTPVTPVTPEPTPVTPVNPEPTPVTPASNETTRGATVIRGDYDTPHMRGIRSAVVGTINAWRTVSDEMYRPRVLQQGEPTGIWARLGGGKYNYSGSGIDIATDYTRIQGGYDANISRGWTVGGQLTYLRGSEDYVFDGSGKVKSFSVGAYGVKDLGKDQYVHIESQVGRVTNDFTVRNEIGETMSGDAKTNAYSIGVRYGKTMKYAHGIYVEPQAQLNYTHYSGRNFNVDNVSVNQSSVNSTSGKLGLEIGKQFGHGNVYTRFAAGRAFTGNVKTSFASGTTEKLTQQDLKGSWTEIAFGGRYGINSNNSVFADISTGLTGDYQADWGVNAGFTHKF